MIVRTNTLRTYSTFSFSGHDESLLLLLYYCFVLYDNRYFVGTCSTHRQGTITYTRLMSRAKPLRIKERDMTRVLVVCYWKIVVLTSYCFKQCIYNIRNFFFYFHTISFAFFCSTSPLFFLPLFGKIKKYISLILKNGIH